MCGGGAFYEPPLGIRGRVQVSDDDVLARSTIRDVLATHFIMWRELGDYRGPQGEWFCECGKTFGISNTAIDHQVDELAAALATPASSVAAGQGEVDRGDA